MGRLPSNETERDGHLEPEGQPLLESPPKSGLQTRPRKKSNVPAAGTPDTNISRRDDGCDDDNDDDDDSRIGAAGRVGNE